MKLPWYTRLLRSNFCFFNFFDLVVVVVALVVLTLHVILESQALGCGALRSWFGV